MPLAYSDIESIRLSLVELRRLFQRRELVALWESAFGRASKLDYADLKLLDAVGETGRHGATVGDIARRLGIDPSRASRQVARAINKGLLRRHAQQGDGRQVLVRVTSRGAKQRAKGSALTRARITLATKGWSASERQRFARLFSHFVAGVVPGAR